MARLSLADFAALPPPSPWGDADNIPWNDPGFSRRMLDEHLNASHDAASRRPEAIDAHVDWIHRDVPRGATSRVLDLGCGPGLYTSRLARLGHACTGIDYSPASIEYAREVAAREGLRCDYRCEDIRQSDFGSGNDLVMLVSGELNVFRPEDARLVLTRARDSMASNAVLLLEAHTKESIVQKGSTKRHWSARKSSVFSDRPHVWLEERIWSPATETAAIRYAIVDGEGGDAEIFGQTFQAYSEDGYQELLAGCGFDEISFYPSLRGEQDDQQESFLVIIGRRLARNR